MFCAVLVTIVCARGAAVAAHELIHAAVAHALGWDVQLCASGHAVHCPGISSIPVHAAIVRHAGWIFSMALAMITIYMAIVERQGTHVSSWCETPSNSAGHLAREYLRPSSESLILLLLPRSSLQGRRGHGRNVDRDRCHAIRFVPHSADGRIARSRHVLLR